MFRKHDFLQNEEKILFHETAHDGYKASTELWKRTLAAKEFIADECHPDFWYDFLNGLTECINQEQAALRMKHGTTDHTASREWGD